MKKNDFLYDYYKLNIDYGNKAKKERLILFFIYFLLEIITFSFCFHYEKILNTISHFLDKNYSFNFEITYSMFLGIVWCIKFILILFFLQKNIEIGIREYHTSLIEKEISNNMGFNNFNFYQKKWSKDFPVILKITDVFFTYMVTPIIVILSLNQLKLQFFIFKFIEINVICTFLLITMVYIIFLYHKSLKSIKRSLFISNKDMGDEFLIFVLIIFFVNLLFEYFTPISHFIYF